MRKTFIATTALAISMLASQAIAQEAVTTEDPVIIAMTDDRIEDQVITHIGAQAELPFILFEDVKLDLIGICPDKCEFQFRADDGKLTLASVKVAKENRYMLLISTRRIEEESVSGFNSQLRAALIDSPFELVNREAGS